MSKKEKLLASAQKFIAKGQIPRAIKDYQLLVDLDPKDIRNRQKLAELYSRAQMTSEALDAFEGVARHYSENGFFLKAIAVYKQMQRLGPDRVSICLNLAELNHKQGLIGNALAEYRVLVSSYEKNGQIQEAMKILHKMKDLEPENLNIRVKIIETHLQHAEPQEAREQLLQTIEMLETKQDNTRLLKIYEFFLPHFPDDPEMKIEQARILISQGEAQRAIPLLKDLLEEKPHDLAVLRQLAEAFRQNKEFALEIQIYLQSLQIQPDDLKLRVGLVRALLDGGEAEEALKRLEEWKNTLHETGQIKALTHFYERLKSALPNEKQVVLTLRSIYEAAGEGKALSGLTPASGEDTVDPPSAEKTEPAGSAQEIGERLEEPEEGAEEIPLEFLEGFAEPTSVSSEAEVASEPKPDAEGIELELDLDFDFEVDPVASERPSGGTAVEIAPFSLDENEGLVLESAVKEDFFDLRSALDEPNEGISEKRASSSPSLQSPKKREIKTDVEVEDPDSHYNLGIAYKEMGLLEEAICEFDKALSEPSLTVPCLSLKGICLVELGMVERAEESYKQALSASELDAEVRKGLLYELGILYEGCGRPGDALESYRAVAAIDPSFRHVEEKMRQLPDEKATRKEQGEAKAKARKSQRISYV